MTEMASVLGGNGVSMWFFVQSLKAVDEIYRQEGRKTLINAARVQIFFGAQDADDLRYVSEQLGETSDVQKDVTRTNGNAVRHLLHARSEHRKEVRRPLMRPDEIRTLDKNKVIILPRGELPIFGTRNFYFADGQLANARLCPCPPLRMLRARKALHCTLPRRFHLLRSRRSCRKHPHTAQALCRPGCGAARHLPQKQAL
ncbi:type IV secretory system conjugative DNA transfer family protein (plasmid) [Mesorhizobium atlanticum]|uniref:type IV secretory system conjugative DNA transfer family protein n=1 Tax=Mesorhizobium atlanticum TaxID=2233532 RepID=UPI003704A05D